MKTKAVKIKEFGLAKITEYVLITEFVYARQVIRDSLALNVNILIIKFIYKIE